jgi:hypothetical protein
VAKDRIQLQQPFGFPLPGAGGYVGPLEDDERRRPPPGVAVPRDQFLPPQAPPGGGQVGEAYSEAAPPAPPPPAPPPPGGPPGTPGPVGGSRPGQDFTPVGIVGQGPPPAVPAPGQAPPGMQLNPRPTYNTAIDQLLNMRFGAQAPWQQAPGYGGQQLAWQDPNWARQREDVLNSLIMSPQERAREYSVTADKFGQEAADVAQQGTGELLRMLGADRQNDVGWAGQGTQRLGLSLDYGTKQAANALEQEKFNYAKSPMGVINTAVMNAQAAGHPLDAVAMDQLIQATQKAYSDSRLKDLMPGVTGAASTPGVETKGGGEGKTPKSAPTDDIHVRANKLLGDELYNRVKDIQDPVEAAYAIIDGKDDKWLTAHQQDVREYLDQVKNLRPEMALEQNKKGVLNWGLSGIGDLLGMGAAGINEMLPGGEGSLDRQAEATRVPTSQGLRRVFSPQEARKRDILEKMYGGGPR